MGQTGPERYRTGRFLAAVSGAPRAVAAGTNYALLIGVMGYPALRERDRLVGPGNDIALVADWLRQSQGLADTDISILLDDGVHPPATLAAIRTEMARLAGTVGPGDFVYLHFSGHGTQAPAPAGSDEPDGLDELFLPYDVGFWSGGTGEVQNALKDDEIGAMIDAIRARGANVWAVFDACNSGTVTRGADEVRLRRIAPEVLGIPNVAADPSGANEPPFDAGGDGPGIGTLTAFFAAQSDQSTPEMNLPRTAAERRPQGLFTFTLMSELAAEPDRSLANLAAAVLARYATEGLAPGTVPGFEGTLDTGPFGATATSSAPEALPQWPVRVVGGQVTIPAGSLHGLGQGDRLPILPDGAATGTAPLAHLTLDAVMPFAASGTLSPAIDLPEGAMARAEAVSLSVRLDIAVPDPTTLPVADAVQLIGGLIAAAPTLARRLVLVPSGAPADLRLAVEEGQIGIVPGGGLANGARPETIPLGLDLAVAGRNLAPLLLREARALLLTRSASALPARLPGIDADVLVMSPGSAAATSFDPTEMPTLFPGDVVSIGLRNAGTRPVDVDILYIAANRTVQHLRQLRTLPGDATLEPLFRVLPEGYGQELILVVQRQTMPGASPDPLTFLTTGAAPTLLRSHGNDGAPSLAQFLAEAGFGGDVRSPMLDSVEQSAILLVPVLTRPAP